MDIKILKNGTISKTSLKKVNFENLDFDNTNDIGMNSVGVLRLCIFNGSFRNARFSRYEYYLVKVTNENYTKNTDFISYTSIKHRFSLDVIQVISGTEKKVGDKFTKRGKNLYGNYHEIEHSSKEYLSLKHESRASLGGTIWE